jgi:hypothetical protein
MRLGRAWRVCSGIVMIATALSSAPVLAQGARLPADAVDQFHAALKRKDTAGALSLLDRGLVVFEFGSVDATLDAYALQHLPYDIDAAVAMQWAVLTRRTGGDGNDRWVLTTYRVTGKDANGTALDYTALETAIVRRTGDSFRIVHLHWSMDPAALAALTPADPKARKGP